MASKVCLGGEEQAVPKKTMATLTSSNSDPAHVKHLESTTKSNGLDFC
jgi:hypothetical protein